MDYPYTLVTGNAGPDSLVNVHIKVQDESGVANEADLINAVKNTLDAIPDMVTVTATKYAITPSTV